MSNYNADKTVIITGGNAGLGYQCARNLAKSGQKWLIILASRDHSRTAEAAERLKKETGYSQIEALELDLASLTSIQHFAKKFKAQDFPPLKALVCNAGLQVASGTTFTKDGFETTFGVNHLGHFLLVNLLLSQLIAPARIIFVSSGTHDPAERTGMPHPQYTSARLLAYPPVEQYSGKSAGMVGRMRYTTSKLCNILCAYELSRRLEEEGFSTTQAPITVNAYDPGGMPGTGLTRDYPKAVQLFVNVAVTALLPLIRLAGIHANTVTASGKSLARLVTDPTLANVSGKYFAGYKQQASSQESYDEQKASELWDGSAELVKLTPAETILRLKLPQL